MTQIQIFHEAPLSIFKSVQTMTDGDYALVHLLEKEPAYTAAFLEVADQADRKRPLILDNSAYELGTSFEAESFATWVLALMPDIYVVPDVIGDAEHTIEAFSTWKDRFDTLPGKKMGVLQGRTPSAAVNCFKILKKLGADVIGIPFLIGRDMAPAGIKLSHHELMHSRISLVKRIHEDCDPHPIHLLGVSQPQEGIYHRQHSWVTSVDTSNPVMHGMFGTRYGADGSAEKRPELLADMIHHDVPSHHAEIVFENIKGFRRFWNRDVCV